ncbi:hypothetical protein [Tianweitania sediminis]|uniref:Uncharacterized protein n=1 Tax=Tianweitania sediminis TaxID=1502156 RepID=A0A8J7RJ79_9HYPH|nr:hypothetical protein [Tianweitania sediminis]MBP0439451.1 hypothetical protein [Tianweitania sediminis]
MRKKILHALGDVLGRDLARPIELTSLVMLLGWLQFLVTKPEIFSLPRYASFSSLPPYGWALIIAGIIAAQLVALGPIRGSTMIRFVAMMLATGIWTIIAISFWAADTSPLTARSHTAFALSIIVTAVYLGLKRQD